MSESPITYDIDGIVTSAIIELGLEEDTSRFLVNLISLVIYYT
jgi:hypothetical protein